ncbi:MAG: hypothetical protein HYR90_01225 [Candidatus Andersenbacteria bacterium]|nr:hypothetical protein [Candidatus Andersenbacteria bacterium]MBI3250491.1 hypothetical protein [Candidatus Andersenbacteria bacterium]
MGFEKVPRFSFSPEEPNEAGWITEANRIIEEENWEDDSDVMQIHSEIRERIKAMGDESRLTAGAMDELFDSYEKEALVQFVEDHSEKASHYANLWSNWTALAGIDPQIEDDEWSVWMQGHKQAKYMGQYRAIARAFRGYHGS